MNIRRKIGECKACGCTFLAVSWLDCRAAGYCSDECGGQVAKATTDFVKAAIRKSVLMEKQNKSLDLAFEAQVAGLDKT